MDIEDKLKNIQNLILEIDKELEQANIKNNNNINENIKLKEENKKLKIVSDDVIKDLNRNLVELKELKNEYGYSKRSNK